MNPTGPAQFRITTIHLDDNEKVISVVAVVHPTVVDRIRELLDDGKPITVLRGGATPAQFGVTLYWIELDVQQVIALAAAAGNLTGKDPRHVPGLYDSLSRIITLLGEEPD